MLNKQENANTSRLLNRFFLKSTKEITNEKIHPLRRHDDPKHVCSKQ